MHINPTIHLTSKCLKSNPFEFLTRDPSTPDACQSLALQRIMEENCTDQMFKTVNVCAKYCLEQHQS